MSRPPGLLLLGTSHVGKSTCAGRLGTALGWPVTSTDRLGRHPGRPWNKMPDAVAEFYLRLTDETIHWFLKVHHENMRSVIQEAIRAARETRAGFIFEGSALRPEYLADWRADDLLAVCLHVESDVLCVRIRSESAYSTRSDETKLAIDRFTERSLRENATLSASAEQCGVRLVDATDFNNTERLIEELTARLSA